MNNLKESNVKQISPKELKETVGGDNITQFIFRAFGRYHRMLETAYSNGYGYNAVHM